MKANRTIVVAVSLGILASGILPPAALHANHCSGDRQRVEVDWKKLSLAGTDSDGAYGEAAISVEDAVRDEYLEPDPDNCPSAVWIGDPSDVITVKRLEGAIFKNEDIGLALKRFRCYRVDVREVLGGDLREKYLREVPAFYFFDPATTLLTKVSGKQAKSLSIFSTHLERTWARSFTMKVKDFRKQMRSILDRRDKLDSKEKVVDRKADRLFERPNSALRKQIEREEAKLEAVEKKIDEAEEALIARCSLRPEFLPEEGSVEDE